MHKTNVPYLNADNIPIILREFALEFNRYFPGEEVNMLVVGGSAIALKYHARGTVDIDSEIRTSHATKRILNNVSKKLNIPSDFINEDFMKSYSYSRVLWKDAICVGTILPTRVKFFVVSDISQLCMKLTSGRDKDFRDITLLSMTLISSGIRFSDVESQLHALYDGRVDISKHAYKYARGLFAKAKLL